jgi:purine nucleosidase
MSASENNSATETAAEKIIIDCDPGHDDAIAIMLALASPELEVLGITVTYGNVGLENTTRNAMVMRELCLSNLPGGSNVPIFAGANAPLVRDRISAESVHGTNGLEGPDLPEPRAGLETMRAAEFMIQSVLEFPGQVTLAPVGPLTNIALAMRLEPSIIAKIKRIVLMGGSTDIGNWTPAAEFNILCDPHAAKIVFSSGVPLTMFGLNLTHQVLATPERAARIRNLGTRVSHFTAELLEFFKLAYQRRYDFSGPALHDPCVIAYLIQPDLFKLKTMNVEIDCTDGPSFGRTVCDVWSVTGKPKNCDVALEADADGFFELLTSRLALYR